ncbi:sugar phosphate isomerase/epimerase family protein [Prevotella sp.]|jgi:sugar phosphate isomerase/epimerase|uniref:sugar phosphate isomerase/epimerase family protein n=1 Tax=uncultured Prevotella sp. TaxID=159272 RepID=UPI002619D438|nr:TIM barrel protein [uncultured Prevotella sp.]
MKFNKVLCITLLFGGLLLSEVMMAQKRYQIGVCDWMVLKRQKLGEFKLARELGCDGLEMDMGGLGKRDSFDNKIRQPEMARLFRHTADSLEIKVGAVAMSGFYGQSFAAKQSWKWLVEDCLNTMQTMQAKVAFLPLGGCGKDWTEKTAIRKEIVFRLHEAGEMAAKRGMVIGIDTPLDAKENKKLLKEIDSPGIKIFYKFQTAVENKRDISKDLRKLGADNICGIHASNTDGVWLRHDKAINMPEIKATLDKLGWSGWLFVERSRDVTDVRNVKRNYGENVKYLKEVFQN